MTMRLPPGGRPERQAEDDRPGELGRRIHDPAFVEDLKAAELVVGVDVRDPETREVFYGRRELERLVSGGQWRLLRVLEVPIDFATDDVEVLCTACLAYKR